MSIIKWIFFDIGSTLVDESVAYKNRIEKTISNTDVGYDEFYQRMVEISKHSQNAYNLVLTEYGLNKVTWNSDDEFVYPEAENCWSELSKHYEIGIIANQNFGSQERLDKLGLLKYINLVIASAEEGVAKPDLRIFEIVLNKADCKAEESVIVGDRLDNDIVPANKIGMKTVRVNQGFGRLGVPLAQEEQPNYIAENLSEVIGVF